MELLGDVGHVESRFSPFGDIVSICLEIVFVWLQDRCMVCTKRTIGSETVLDTPDGTPS